MYKHRKRNPKIELIINAPSFDKKALERTENGHIKEYAEKYGKDLINIKSNPNVKKVENKVEYKVKIENKQQLEERIAKLEKKLTIKDDKDNKLFFFDAIIDGKRHKTMARYGKTPKSTAMTKISKKKQDKINELTIYFE